MGVKELWSILTPYCDRKPIYELQGKIVAIDLAGWVCESLNVVDYFVHPRHHLKNLYFRTCYLLLEGVTPVFVLEGTAPKLKSQVIAKRNELQFRGVKPKNTQNQAVNNQSGNIKQTTEKGRTRFNHVLKQCEDLLRSMGIQCVQGPGEAEAYCSFLNQTGLVDGVISQDSDCFAYGAIVVYRNFSVSTQGNSASQGGAVDVYDMRKICNAMDFGQNKVVVMALLCGCDYCPEGVGGVGKDSVLKLFNKYKNNEIIERLKSWRNENSKYTALEMKVDDKNICSNCGHLGKTLSHTKNGCGTCRTHKGCDDSLWKEERISIKSELLLRKKALVNPEFPSQEIIDEFLNQPSTLPNLFLKWKQPNLVKFVRNLGHLLQWTEIYCVQKFLPLLTRWQLKHFNDDMKAAGFFVVDCVLKKRTLRGIPCYEIMWKDERRFFNGLIPDEQIKLFCEENPKGLHDLWSTIEPIDLVERAYPELVETFLISKEKPKKAKKPKTRKPKAIQTAKFLNSSLNDMTELLQATEDIGATIKPKKSNLKGNQLISKFLHQKEAPAVKSTKSFDFGQNNCSTPKNSFNISNLESDNENDFNMSAIINGIVHKKALPLQKYSGKSLFYQSIKMKENLDMSKDDLVLLETNKRNLSFSFLKNSSSKRIALDDSLLELPKKSVVTHVDRFIEKELNPRLQRSPLVEHTNSANICAIDKNVSYFFENNYNCDDEFEKSLEISFLKMGKEDNMIVISDDSYSSE